MSLPIQFFSEEINVQNYHREFIREIIRRIATDHDFTLSNIHVVILNDNELKAINEEFLGHNYFTDVISFDLSENEEEVSGEIYISSDRIMENANHYRVDFKEELYRVIIHGSLHLVGYSDGTDEDKRNMHRLEDHYLLIER